MNKGRAWFAIAMASLTVGGATFVACEDSKDPSNFPDNGQDASFDSGGTFQLDGSTKPDAPLVCNPNLSANFDFDASAFSPRPHEANCTLEQLIAYDDACIEKNVDAGPNCTGFTKKPENAACAACLESDDQSGAIQWYFNRDIHTLNLSRCMAIVATDGGACPAAYDKAVDCSRASCLDCLQRGGGFDDFQACQRRAQQAGCKGTEDRVDAVCGPTISKNPQYATCFAGSGEELRIHRRRFLALLCGK